MGMRLVRIGTAAVSVKVGDFKGNAARLTEVIEAARAQQVHLLVTPELCISGYSLEDRIYWPEIVQRSWEALHEIAKSCTGIDVFIGLPVRIHGLAHNAAAFVSNGKVHGLVLKRYIPTYSIFYEGRNWSAWGGGVTEYKGVPAGDLVFRLPYGMVTAEICEDLWTASSPARDRVQAGAEIICNPSASPFLPGKNSERKRLVQGTAANLKSIYAYSNLLGCDNSRLVFDGGGLIATPDELLCDMPILSMQSWTLGSAVVNLDDLARQRSENTTWRESAIQRNASNDNAKSIGIVDISGNSYSPAPLTDYVAQMPHSFYMPDMVSSAPPGNPYLDELFDALVLGLRDYFEKVGAFKRFLIALSGGRDSALCLLMAVQAAKALHGGADSNRYAEQVSTVYLPNKSFSSSETREAAQSLAEELGVPFQVVTIHEESEVALAKAVELAGGEHNIAPMARQNLQARIRGAMMLNWSNSVGGLVLVTSNLSEAAVGYSTTGGDNQGGYSPIANIPKSLISALLEYLSERDGIKSIQKILALAPSAELTADQQDEKDLMPYVVLDDLLYLYARRRLSLVDCWQIVCQRHTDHSPDQLKTWAAQFARLFAQSQWKRDQHPVALKVMDLDLDPKTGFRFPVTQSIEHELIALQNAEASK